MINPITIRAMWSAAGKNPQYVPLTPEAVMGYLIEEAGEVQQVAGKILRWGLNSRYDNGETNRQAILRELSDLELAVSIIREILQ